MAKRLATSDSTFQRDFDQLLASKREASVEVDDAVRQIIAEVRARGDQALLDLDLDFLHNQVKAPCSVAIALITVNIEVPTSGSFERISGLVMVTGFQATKCCTIGSQVELIDHIAK